MALIMIHDSLIMIVLAEGTDSALKDVDGTDTTMTGADTMLGTAEDADLTRACI